MFLVDVLSKDVHLQGVNHPTTKDCLKGHIVLACFGSLDVLQKNCTPTAPLVALWDRFGSRGPRISWSL